MPSDYNGFDVKVSNGDGTTTPVAGAAVKVYDATASAALADLATDGGGHVAAGTLAVEPGTLVYFAVVLDDQRCGFAQQVTY